MFNLTRKKNLDLLGINRLTVPLLPLRDIVIFPHMVAPLFIGREKSIKALENAMTKDRTVFLATQIDAKTDIPQEKDIHHIGTLGTILQLLRLPDGTVKALIEGKRRAGIQHFIPNPDFFLVEVERLAHEFKNDLELKALLRSINSTFEAYAKINKKIPHEVVQSIESINDPSRLADIIAAHLGVKIEEKQKLLELADPSARLEKLYALMRSEIEILQIEHRIKSRVKKQMEKTQKDYYLNEQMRAIQKEMGEKDDFKSELKELETKINRKRMSKEAAAKIRNEFKKLKLMSPMSAEATVVRNYIDWLLALPWYNLSRTKIDINEAERILDEDHYGLKKPKERISEYLAVQSLVKKVRGPILCLVGPPGVGKTSIAKSVARATGRSFIRLSLGGVRDEAEIRGHRRTYIGAMPGKIIQSLRKVKTNNPVFCLDEVDKMSTDFRGDPAAALLEVLDPEQNMAFNDHYMDVDYDLSDIMFITTANTLYSIPLPLQDRMEIIRLPGYTEDEKLNIAKQFLLRKQQNANGLKPEQIEFSDNAILSIVREYTKESGVRNLEREIASVCRKVAKEVLKSGTDKLMKVSSSSIAKYLGVQKYRYGKTEEKNEVGLTTGLAWTEVGGELLQTEVVLMPGKGRLIITGKLGEVMQESAQAAMSYVRSRANSIGLPLDFYQKVDIHIHVPEGAIPKDGPSAGITIGTSIVSALLKKPVKNDVAMTGEITLRGRVLPIGGLKEKMIAANRAGVKTVIIPKENEKDLKDIPNNILRSMNIVPVDHMDQVLREALALNHPDELFINPMPEPFSLFQLENIIPSPEIRTH
ncbi:MAG: endopeptidase La [Deltaproteobacteria bacterium]|nr:endopeptidase La [Deltaproteobacteria bacterium]